MSFMLYKWLNVTLSSYWLGPRYPKSVDFSLGNVYVRYGAILNCVGLGRGQLRGCHFRAL
jgi:hypothetical protein